MSAGLLHAYPHRGDEQRTCQVKICDGQYAFNRQLLLDVLTGRASSLKSRCCESAPACTLQQHIMSIEQPSQKCDIEVASS